MWPLALQVKGTLKLPSAMITLPQTVWHAWWLVEEKLKSVPIPQDVRAALGAP